MLEDRNYEDCKQHYTICDCMHEGSMYRGRDRLVEEEQFLPVPLGDIINVNWKNFKF